ncbi:MAG: RIO1 family regulatory kinase/ATPase, partial [Candidatus Bathyarchaeia archaeon]
PDNHVLIIDWPQYVTNEHPNAQQLLKRDIENVLKFFERKHLLKAKTDEAFAYVTGKEKMPYFLRASKTM